jgi:hypothetical protein
MKIPSTTSLERVRPFSAAPVTAAPRMLRRRKMNPIITVTAAIGR